MKKMNNEKTKLLADFNLYLTDRGFSETTKATYIGTVKAFLKSDLTLNADGMMKYLRILNNSKNTIQTKFYILKSFLSVSGLENNFPKPPKKSINLPRYLTESEAKKILRVASQLGDAKAFMILSFMLYTGVRVSELVGIEIKDISFENSTVRIRGKGDKERIVPLPQKYLKLLKKYTGKRTGYLFLTRRKNSYERFGIFAMVKKYARLAGIKKNVSPHILRHTFATLALSNGTDPFTIKEVLGHSSLNTTLKYAHVLTKNMSKAVESVADAINIGEIEGGEKNDEK